MKKYLLGIITGLLISGGVVFAAKYLYKADEVSYDSKDATWNVDNVDSAIKSLYSMINEVNSSLTDLKNTDIAKAVGANGNSFDSVISKLGEIVNRGAWSTSVTSDGSVTIPRGFHDGTGKVNVNVNNNTKIMYGLVYANGIKAGSTSINLSGYDMYIISVHCWSSTSNVTASGCGAVRLSQTVDEGTLATFICTSSGTVTINASAVFQNIHVVGIKKS